MKCAACGNKIQEIYLKKIKGTYVKNEKGKMFSVCDTCQQKHQDKDKLLEAISG